MVTWKGGFELDPGNPEKSSGGLSIEAASIVTGNARRDRVMRERVLETGKFPLITFAVDKLSGDWSHFQPGQTLTAELSGRLTIHGVTQPVELSVQCTVLPDGVLVAGGLPVHWHDFGLWNPSNFFNKVRDPMMVVFRLRGVPGQPENP